MRVGDIVVTKHDIPDATGSKTLPAGALFKVSRITLIDMTDYAGGAVRLKPLSSDEDVEEEPIYIRDVITCEELIDKNTNRAYQILKRKNYEQDVKIYSKAIIPVSIYFVFGLACIALNSALVLTPVFAIITALVFAAVCLRLRLGRQCGLVRKNAIRCLLDLRSLRASNPNVQWIPLDCSACGVKISTAEIERQALNARVQADMTNSQLSQYGLGLDGSEYAVYKAIAENTLENLRVFQDFLRSKADKETT